MFQAHVIEVEGTFIGAAVAVQDGYLFRSVHPRLESLDSWTCASLGEVRRVAHRYLMAGRSGAPTPSHLPQALARHGTDAARPTHRAPPAASGLSRWMAAWLNVSSQTGRGGPPRPFLGGRPAAVQSLGYYQGPQLPAW